MTATCVVGLQWGDEAKGKIVDLLTEQHDVVVRYQGGANAGHTVVTRGTNLQTFPGSQRHFPPPSAVRYRQRGSDQSGQFLAEIDGLSAGGVKVAENLMIRDRAHVIFPWHVEEDKLLDRQCTSGESIGTTQRGIGPCYSDKVGRSFAIRMGDMYRPGLFERIEKTVRQRIDLFSLHAGAAPSSPSMPARYSGSTIDMPNA